MAQPLSLLSADIFLSVHFAALFGLMNLAKNFYSFFLSQEKRGVRRASVMSGNVFLSLMLYFLEAGISNALLKCGCLSVVGDKVQPIPCAILKGGRTT